MTIDRKVSLAGFKTLPLQKHKTKENKIGVSLHCFDTRSDCRKYKWVVKIMLVFVRYPFLIPVQLVRRDGSKLNYAKPFKESVCQGFWKLLMSLKTSRLMMLRNNIVPCPQNDSTGNASSRVPIG
jgi:hypothetical protein